MKPLIKKIVVLTMIAVVAVFFATSCETQKQDDKKGKLKIVTVMYPQFDFASHIGKDKADVKMLLKPGAESHSYEPSPQDIKDIQNCDLFIWTGGENEQWVEDILKDCGDKAPKSIKLVDMVDTVEEEIVDGMEHHHDEGEEHHHDIDEHVWTSPENVINICKQICREMKKLDKDNGSYYQDNCKEYTDSIDKLDKETKEVVENGVRKTIVVGDRFPLRYFADHYGLKYYAAFPGCSDQADADASTIAFLIEKVKAENIPVVFNIELSDGKIADSICEATGSKKMTIYSGHNVSEKEFKKGMSYTDMMQKNKDALKVALN